MPVIDPCLSGDCVTELYNILNSGLVFEWPKARIQIENALDVILSSIGNSSPFAFTVPNGTQVKDYRALLWPTGLPNATTYPYLVVVNAGDIWVAPNNPAYDIGTVPATPGTGTKWINMTTLVQPSQRQAQGRLTLTSGTPAPTAGVTGATTLYYSPFIGNLLSLWDGTKSVDYPFAETPLALTGLTNGLNYDIFGYLNAGALALEPAGWSTDVARAAALTRVADGYLCKGSDPTRRLLGTIRMSALGQTEDSIAKRYVNNLYNKIPRHMRVVDATASWVVNTNVSRSLNNSNANRVEFVRCVAEDPVIMHCQGMVSIFCGSGIISGGIGLGLDVVTLAGAYAFSYAQNGSTNTTFAYNLAATLEETPAIGYHFIQACEYYQNGGGSGQISLYGTTGAVNRTAWNGWVMG